MNFLNKSIKVLLLFYFFPKISFKLFFKKGFQKDKMKGWYLYVWLAKLF
jgi:hypothetical protein